MILLLHCNLHVPPCYPTACIAATRRTLDADTRGCTPPRIPAHGRDRNGPGSAHRWSRGGREDPLAATHEFLFLFGSWGTTRRQPSPCAACVSFQNLLALPFALSFWWILMGGGGGGSFKVGGHPQPISISRAHSKRGFVVWILISVSRHVFNFFFRSRRDLFIFFDFFFFASRTARSGEFWFYSNLIFLWRICVTINTGITIRFVYSSICKRTRKYLFRCLRIFVMITNYRTLLFKLKRINWKDVYAYKNDDSCRRIKFKDHVVSPENSFKIISSSENKIFGIIIHRPGLPFKMYQTQIRRWNIIRRERE